MEKQKKKYLKKLSLPLLCYMAIFDSVSLFGMDPNDNSNQENKKILRKSIPSITNEEVNLINFFEQNSYSEEGLERKEFKKKPIRQLSFYKNTSSKISDISDSDIEPSIRKKTFERSSSSSLSPKESLKDGPCSLSIGESAEHNSPTTSSEKSKWSNSSPLKKEKSKRCSSPSKYPAELKKNNSPSLNSEKLKRSRSFSRTEKLKMHSLFSSKTNSLEKNSSSSVSPTSKQNIEEIYFESLTLLKKKGTAEDNSSMYYIEFVEFYFNKRKLDLELKNILLFSPPESTFVLSEAEKMLAIFETEKTLVPSKLGTILVYSYAFFTDEKYLFAAFKELKKIYPMEITAFLEQLALAAFPNGIKELKLAEVEFNELKKELVISPIFNIFLCNDITINELISVNIKKISAALIYDQLNGFNGVEMNNVHIGKFIDALMARDRYLFEAISIKDIKNDLENQQSPPESITTLRKHFNQTASWVALNIVSSDTEKERDKRFKLFCCIGKLLLQRNNFY
nr:hypothetical protein [Alphaproteobacteria bacterium]